MFKFIHTSDWHLGQRFYGYSRDAEHEHFFHQLSTLLQEEQPDALVVSGDVFDSISPSYGLCTKYVQWLLQLHHAAPDTHIILTPGNHDSAALLEVDRRLWEANHVHVFGTLQRNTDGTCAPEQFIYTIPHKAHILTVPYFYGSYYPALSEKTLHGDRKSLFFQTLIDRALEDGEEVLPIVLMAHLAVEGCHNEEPEARLLGRLECEALTLLGEGYDYAALGHIHRPRKWHTNQAEAAYCGSPFPLSFSEDFHHGVSLVTIEAHGAPPQVRFCELPPLRTLHTLPPQPLPLEEALDYLENYTPTEDCYVRLQVSTPDVLPADAEERARKAAAGKNYRYCELVRCSTTPARAAEMAPPALDIDAIQQLHPIDVAQQYMQKKFNKNLDADLLSLLQQAIDSTMNPTDTPTQS